MDLKKLSGRILDLLYPPKCAFCRRLVQDGRMLCPDCERKLPFPEKELQIQHIPPLALCLSPLYYTEDVRLSLQRYKFHGAAAYSRIYGELMAGCLEDHGLSADLVTWVPLSKKRLRSRGYDQARLLAVEVAQREGLQCRKLLTKHKHNRTQSGAGGPAERFRNVQGVYRPADEAAGKRVLLVDDIVTTGATLGEAAAVLLQAGAKEVIGLTLARNERQEVRPGRNRYGNWNGESQNADI